MDNMNKSERFDRIINFLLIFVIIFASTTGWNIIDLVGGMSVFWLIFISASLAMTLLILLNYGPKISLGGLFKNKLNILLLIYSIWMSFTYLVNYQGRSTLLYIFKMLFIIGIYMVTVGIYLENTSYEVKDKLIQGITKVIFALGTMHSIIAIYQYVSLSNVIFGIQVTEWPAYNPASLYGNVNGLGSYLFFSLVSGVYLIAKSNKGKALVAFILVIQAYVMYFTIARTSIVITIVYFILVPILFFIKKREAFAKIFSIKVITAFITANLIMLCVINFWTIINSLPFTGKESGERRETTDMLSEKNSRGFNQRQFIWKAVIEDYEEYILVGDGLKFNIIDKINVEEVISKKSKGVDRISYHNTLFRYFASNGLMGLLIFLFLYAYIPIMLLYSMVKTKYMHLYASILIVFLGCIFLYMQMEEVYIGEIGFVQLVTVTAMALGNSLILEKNKSRFNKV